MVIPCPPAETITPNTAGSRSLGTEHGACRGGQDLNPPYRQSGATPASVFCVLLSLTLLSAQLQLFQLHLNLPSSFCNTCILLQLAQSFLRIRMKAEIAFNAFILMVSTVEPLHLLLTITLMSQLRSKFIRKPHLDLEMRI